MNYQTVVGIRIEPLLVSVFVEPPTIVWFTEFVLNSVSMVLSYFYQSGRMSLGHSVFYMCNKLKDRYCQLLLHQYNVSIFLTVCGTEPTSFY